jgi:hypothetical protein
VTTCDSSKPFGAPVQIPGTYKEDESLFLSDDFLTAVFGSKREGSFGGVDMFFATRRAASEPFGEAKHFDFTSGANERFPILSHDLLRLYFTYDVSGTELFLIQRANPTLPFREESPLISGLDGGGGGIMRHWLSADEKLLYFDSYREGGKGGNDVYVADFAIHVASNVRNLATINTADDENGPVVTADGLTLYFSSNRAGASPPDPRQGQGGFIWNDIWVARRSSTTAAFGPSEPVAELNAPILHDDPVWVSSDGCTLFFRRGDRYEGSLLQASRGL